MPQPVHIVFIHGLANKPPAADLRRIWLTALAENFNNDAGFDPGAVGVTVSFTYWADLFYDKPIPAADYENRSDELAGEVEEDLSSAEGKWIEAMRAHYPEDDETFYEEPPINDQTPEYERIPIPWLIKKRVMRHFVREAHDYLFNVSGIRDTIRKRVLDDLNSAAESARLVLAGHSQGSFIAFDVLSGANDCPQVDGLLTFGSPLGLDEIQDHLVMPKGNSFPAKLQGDWVNVFDPYDVVSRPDPRLANDFPRDGKEVVIDIEEENWGKWRHSASKYLKGRKLRSHLRRLCNRE